MRWLIGIGVAAVIGIAAFLVWELRGDGDEPDGDGEPPGRVERRARADSSLPARTPPPRPRARAALVDAGTTDPADEATEPAPDRPRLTAPVAGMGWHLGLPDPRYDAGPEDVQRYRVIILKRTYREGKFEAARDLAMEMVRVYPDEPQGYLHAVYASCAMGDMVTAREYYGMMKDKNNLRIARKHCRELSAPLED